AGPAPVHRHGRALVSHASVERAVHRAGTVGGAPAGPPASRQYIWLLDLRRHFGLVGCDDAGGGTHGARRAVETRLRQERRHRLGYDPIWFGVFLVLVVEMAQVTPPVGFNRDPGDDRGEPWVPYQLIPSRS